MTAIVKKTRENSIVQEAVPSCEPKKFFTPGRNVESTKQKLRDVRPYFRVRNTANTVVASVIGIGGIPGSLYLSGSLMNSGVVEIAGGIVISIFGLVGLPILGMCIAVSGAGGKVFAAGDELETLNLQVFNKWIRARYGINVMYRHPSYNSENAVQYAFKKAASYGIKDSSESIDFRGDDNNWYVLEGDENGDLFVRRRNEEGEARTVFDAFSAVTVKSSLSAILPTVDPKAMPRTDYLLFQVKELVGKLSIFDVTVEQKHVLNRAVAEAEEAVDLLTKMRVLRADASDVDAVHVLDGCLKDVKGVSEDVYSTLADKATVSTQVVSMRDKYLSLLT